MSLALGHYYEQVACHYLKQQGLFFLNQNYRCRLGEIDLIFKDTQQLIFVEVKYRHHAALESPLNSIHQKKQQRILYTIEHYLQRHQHLKDLNPRLDFILIQSPKNQHTHFQIEWLQNVWLE